MMVERRTANGVAEVCQLTGKACPKAAKKWLAVLGIRVQPGNLVVNIDYYHKRVRMYNEGKLKPLKRR